MKSIGEGDHICDETSPALRWSGLKYVINNVIQIVDKSPALRWSGLKYAEYRFLCRPGRVSGFALEWIEIE